MFEKRLPGCRVWECELLLTAKKLYEPLLPGALPTPKAKAITPETSSFPWYLIGSRSLDPSAPDSSQPTKILQISYWLLMKDAAPPSGDHDGICALVQPCEIAFLR